MTKSQKQDAFRNDLGQWMLAVLSKKEWSAEEWAEKAGVDAARITYVVSTIHKTIKPVGDTKDKPDSLPSGQSLYQLASVAPIPLVLGRANAPDTITPDVVRNTVQNIMTRLSEGELPADPKFLAELITAICMGLAETK